MPHIPISPSQPNQYPHPSPTRSFLLPNLTSTRSSHITSSGTVWRKPARATARERALGNARRETERVSGRQADRLASWPAGLTAGRP